jgi:hypothetical protein
MNMIVRKIRTILTASLAGRFRFPCVFHFQLQLGMKLLPVWVS